MTQVAMLYLLRKLGDVLWNYQASSFHGILSTDYAIYSFQEESSGAGGQCHYKREQAFPSSFRHLAFKECFFSPSERFLGDSYLLLPSCYFYFQYSSIRSFLSCPQIIKPSFCILGTKHIYPGWVQNPFQGRRTQ